jgi:hypothetical protein
MYDNEFGVVLRLLWQELPLAEGQKELPTASQG